MSKAKSGLRQATLDSMFFSPAKKQKVEANRAPEEEAEEAVLLTRSASVGTERQTYKELLQNTKTMQCSPHRTYALSPLLRRKRKRKTDCLKRAASQPEESPTHTTPPKDKESIAPSKKDFDRRTCSECGMMYAPGVEEDEKLHSLFHRSHLRSFKWPKQKDEEMRANGEAIIIVQEGDHAGRTRKCNDIREMVEKELGMESRASTWTLAIIYVSSNREVIGCAFAEQTAAAFKVSSGPRETKTNDTNITCSNEAQPVEVGIGSIWVHKDHRRQGIATTIMDRVREKFLFGCVINKDKVAFSQPTFEGSAFANAYTGKSKFLVY